MSGYTLFAAQFLAVLRAPRQIRFVNRLFGGLFVGAAALLATFKRGAYRSRGLLAARKAGTTQLRSSTSKERMVAASKAPLPPK